MQPYLKTADGKCRSIVCNGIVLCILKEREYKSAVCDIVQGVKAEVNNGRSNTMWVKLKLAGELHGVFRW